MVAVLPADNVEILPDSQATTGLLRQQAAVPLELPLRQQEPLFYRSDAPKAVFAAELRRHRQKITAGVTSRVTLDPAGGRVEQKFAYSIAYEPTDYFLLEVPRELSAKGRLVLNYEDQVLTPVVLGEEADDGVKPLRMRVALPKACTATGARRGDGTGWVSGGRGRSGTVGGRADALPAPAADAAADRDSSRPRRRRGHRRRIRRPPHPAPRGSRQGPRPGRGRRGRLAPRGRRAPRSAEATTQACSAAAGAASVSGGALCADGDSARGGGVARGAAASPRHAAAGGRRAAERARPARGRHVCGCPPRGEERGRGGRAFILRAERRSPANGGRRGARR